MKNNYPWCLEPIIDYDNIEPNFFDVSQINTMIFELLLKIKDENLEATLFNEDLQIWFNTLNSKYELNLIKDGNQKKMADLIVDNAKKEDLKEIVEAIDDVNLKEEVEKKKKEKYPDPTPTIIPTETPSPTLTVTPSPF